MKTQFLNITKAIFLAFFISITLTACSSNDLDLPEEPQNMFSTLINGGQYTTDNVSAFDTASSNFFTIVTVKENGEGINISIPSNEVGTYTVTDGIFDDFILSYTASNNDFLVSTSGTLTITEKLQIDKNTIRIKGNFSFSLVDTNGNIVYELTEGSFSIEYLSV